VYVCIFVRMYAVIIFARARQCVCLCACFGVCAFCCIHMHDCVFVFVLAFVCTRACMLVCVSRFNSFCTHVIVLQNDINLCFFYGLNIYSRMAFFVFTFQMFELDDY